MGEKVVEDNCADVVNKCATRDKEALWVVTCDSSLGQVIVSLSYQSHVVRRVVNEQARLRQLQQQQQQVGSRGRDAEVEWRMSMALAQFSMENTVFAKEWAVLKLLDD
eukprot:scaffold5771_cov184-Skeletonema_marinoi.AAC.1